MSKLAHGISFGLLPSELIVDNFAGGGGASLGIEMALGRSPDIAINHDREAIAMHAVNHPCTKHYCEDVWEVNPVEACAGRSVGLAWFSPDCKHFSKAKGGKPVSKKIRGLAWIVVKWAKAVQPRVIILENVEEFQDWGPLDDEGRPCPERKGKTFQRWHAQLRNLGYQIEWRELRACDYSAPTIRKRLFIVARRDGQRIVWPEPTHANPKKIGTDLFSSHLHPWRTAAECIDWSIPCPSIFDRKKPLAENTLRRVAAGLRKFVIDCPEPFIVSLTHHGGDRVEPLDERFRTVAGAKRGEKALVTPYLAGVGGRAGQSPERSPLEPYQTITAKADAAIICPTLIQTGYGEREGQAPRVPGLDKPLGTVVAGAAKHALMTPLLVGTGGPTYSAKPRTANQPFHTMTADSRAAVVSAFLAQHNGERQGVKPGRPASDPLSTITSTGGQQQIVTSNLVKLRGTCRHGQPVDEPLATVSAQGLHLAEVRAFLIAYYGNERDGASLHEPMRTTTSKERFGLVTIHDEDYVIADIGLRMLTPRELYRAQGFHDGYVIDFEFEGKPLSKTAQVRMCGNSVSPPNAAAMVRAQFGLTPVELAA